jgi:hypothetical protein
MSRTRNKDWRGQNKMSKRYTVQVDIWESDYAAGGSGRGHKPRHRDNQSLSQQVRSKEKRAWKNEISNALY